VLIIRDDGYCLPRIGVLMNRAANDREGQARLAAFQQGLQQAGWSVGRNARIDLRWGEDDLNLESKYAAELVALRPDIIFVSGTLSVAAVKRLSRTVPIVFVGVTDPLGAGFVDSLARPGGNATGFMIYEYSLSGKWLELLKEIAPSVLRVAIIRNPDNPAGIAVFSAIQAEARSLRIEVTPVDSRSDASDMESRVKAFARSANGGLILTPSAAAMPAGYKLIITLAAQLKLPTIYPFPYMVAEGGLMSHSPNVIDQSRQAAGYVDRILKGEKPGDLPVQEPNEYELAINIKTAKTLGLTVPPALLAQADQVIE
jgi:putative tryptophan/tyrosine transport system substrate-binding protein